MQDDPDIEAMANRPKLDHIDLHINQEDLETSVIAGGPSGGLFLPDHDSDSASDIEDARADAENQLRDGVDSDTYANDQLMRDLSDEDNDSAASSVVDEADDPIVASHDIYSTKRLADHLYLFQYPIRPPDRQYTDQDRPTEARMKPRAQVVELDVPIAETAYYDQRRGRQWTDHSLRTQTMAGRISGGRNYLIGVMEKGSLYVTPVKGVVQMRPNFKYIDSHDAQEKESKRSETNGERNPRAAKAIQVSAKSSDAVPDLSTTSILRAAEEESWIKLQWKDQYDAESLSVSQWLLTKKTNIRCESMTDKAAYLDLLSTTGQEDTTVKIKK